LPSDWLETPLRKPNCGEGIVSIKPRLNSLTQKDVQFINVGINVEGDSGGSWLAQVFLEKGH